jgi:hypothetical protein
MTRGLSIMTAWGTGGLGVLSGIAGQPASEQQAAAPFSQPIGGAIGLPLSTSHPPVTSLSIRPRMPCCFFYYYTLHTIYSIHLSHAYRLPPKSWHRSIVDPRCGCVETCSAPSCRVVSCRVVSTQQPTSMYPLSSLATRRQRQFTRALRMPLTRP